MSNYQPTNIPVEKAAELLAEIQSNEPETPFYKLLKNLGIAHRTGYAIRDLLRSTVNFDTYSRLASYAGYHVVVNEGEPVLIPSDVEKMTDEHFVAFYNSLPENSAEKTIFSKLINAFHERSSAAETKNVGKKGR